MTSTLEPRNHEEHRLSVLIVDDHDGFLRAVIPTINADAELQVVATVHSGAEALKVLATEHVDVALVDVHMSPMSGIEVARRHAETSGQTAIVLMSTSSLDELPDAAQGPTVAGFQAKESLSTTNLKAAWWAWQIVQQAPPID